MGWDGMGGWMDEWWAVCGRAREKGRERRGIAYSVKEHGMSSQSIRLGYLSSLTELQEANPLWSYPSFKLLLVLLSLSCPPLRRRVSQSVIHSPSGRAGHVGPQIG